VASAAHTIGPSLLGARFRLQVRTIGMYALTLFAVVTVVFLLPRAMPGDPLAALEDPTSGYYLTDPELRERILGYYGLDQPLPQQYVEYLGDVATLDLGWSIARNAPVRSLIADHLPWTLLLMGSALALSSAFSYIAGITAAWRRGRVDDRALVVALTVSKAIPEYALASLFLLAFAVLVPIFPLFGARTYFAEYSNFLAEVADVAYHLALPLVALTVGLVGSKFLLVRNTVIGALGQDYMVAARAKGLPVRMQKYRHAGRNALLPFLTVLGIQSAFAVGGSIFVETVFGYPGMGVLILDAVTARDYPVLEGAFLTLAATVLAANVMVDLVYNRIDPRVASP
jgi:peptide/nickel transport system permease protein